MRKLRMSIAVVGLSAVISMGGIALTVSSAQAAAKSASASVSAQTVQATSAADDYAWLYYLVQRILKAQRAGEDAATSLI